MNARKMVMRRHTSKEAYFRELNTIIEAVFVRSVQKGWTIPKLAHEAGISPQTVVKFALSETRFPRFKTVWSLARAVGLQISWIERKAKRRAA